MSGMVIGARQTYEYFQRIQEQIVAFVARNSRIEKAKFEEYMMATGEMATDVGTILYGKEAVSSGLIDKLGGLSDALFDLHAMINEQKKSKEESESRFEHVVEKEETPIPQKRFTANDIEF